MPSLIAMAEYSRPPVTIPPGLDPAYYALSLLRRRRLSECIAVATAHQRIPTSLLVNQWISDSAATSDEPKNSTTVNKNYEESIGHDISCKDVSGSAPRSSAVQTAEQLWYIQTTARVRQNWFSEAEVDNDIPADAAVPSRPDMRGKVVRTNDACKAVESPSTTHEASSDKTNVVYGSDSNTDRPHHHATVSGSKVWLHASSVTRGAMCGFARSSTVSSGSVAGSRVRPVSMRRTNVAAARSADKHDDIDVSKLCLPTIARTRPMFMRLLCDYVFYAQRKPRLALDVCRAVLETRRALPFTPSRSVEHNIHRNSSNSIRSFSGRSTRSKANGPANKDDNSYPCSARAFLRRTTASPSKDAASSPTSHPSSSSRAEASQHYTRFGNSNGISEDAPCGALWVWKAYSGRACYQLGLLQHAGQYYRDALLYHPHTIRASEQSPKSGHDTTAIATSTTESISSKCVIRHYHTRFVMELGKVYHDLCEPRRAEELYTAALESHAVDTHILLCMARQSARLRTSGLRTNGDDGNTDSCRDNNRANTRNAEHEAIHFYAQVLRLDGASVEALACAAAHCLYSMHSPELAMRYYRRLLQMGVQSAELWNNMALCAMEVSQLELSLYCFWNALHFMDERSRSASAESNKASVYGSGDYSSLSPVDSSVRADVYYNIGHLGLRMGDVRFAEQAFRLCVAVYRHHAEALNNLAVLAFRRRRARAKGEASATAAAKSLDEHRVNHLLTLALTASPQLTESIYNAALIQYHYGNLEFAFALVRRALRTRPDHIPTLELQRLLRQYVMDEPK